MASPKGKKSARLSQHVVPERYAVTFKPDFQKFSFEGKETISATLSKSSKTLTLHSKELSIETVEISVGAQKLFPLRISYNDSAETATFHFTKPIPAGKVKIHLTFRGILNDKLRGFYRSQYEVAGQVRHMATTQFEATDARRAFPCFDEPALKAVFDVTLQIPTHTIAISNTMPVSEEDTDGGLREVRFAPTPKMSTYLLAFIVGEFEHVETRTKEGTLVRVFVTPGKKHQANFALKCASQMLSFYNDYFDIAYPLPVLDLIAIPDFSAGAMENWGAITYRESALLIDEKHSSSATKQHVATVIAHELAHQWFGNLVTMEWWTHLWLNEGFASYIAYVAVDNMFPKWRVWTQFSSYDQPRALSLDALATTHPIEIPVHHPSEITEIFDEVSYSKGASVLHMLAQFLGEKTFRDGLRLYLKKHSYKNASTVHLWEAFEKVSKKPVRKMMKVWTTKPGYPVVSVTAASAGKFRVSQSRFFANPHSKKQEKTKDRWFIPLFVSGHNAHERVLDVSMATFPEPKGVLQINAGGAGFYRTAYAPEYLKTFVPLVKNKKLSEIDRLGLIRDAFALAEGGEVKTEDTLEFLRAYTGETSYPVWSEISAGLSKLNLVLAGTEHHEAFRTFARSIYRKIAEKMGWQAQKGEEHADALLRSLALYIFGFFGDLATQKQAHVLFEKHLNGLSIAPDLRSVVYNLVAVSGGQKEFEALKKLYIHESLHEEKNRISRAMAFFTDPKIMEEFLNFAISSHVRAQDSLYIVLPAFSNPFCRDAAWSFTKKHWPFFLERYGAGGYGLSRFAQSLGAFTTRAMYTEVKAFFKTHPAPGAARAITQALEKIDGNIRWVQRNGIMKW